MSNTVRVLVVDDEYLLAELLSFHLKQEGFEVVSSMNGKEAFQIYQSQPFEVVVSDVRMPFGDGVELLKNIKALGDLPLFYFITAFADINESEAKELGAKAFFHKPTDIQDLIAKIKSDLTA